MLNKKEKAANEEARKRALARLDKDLKLFKFLRYFNVIK